MTNYGEVLHELRVGKQMTLAKTAGDIVSASFLARFEKGDTNISLEHFTRILQRLNVSPLEFFALANNFSAQVFDDLFTQITEQATIDLTRNSAVVGQYVSLLAKKLTHTTQRLPVLLALDFFQTLLDVQHLAQHANMTNVSQRLLQGGRRAKNYLLSVDTWGEFEMKILTRFASMISASELRPLVQLAVQKIAMYQQQAVYEDYMFRLLNSVFFATVYTDTQLSAEILTLMSREMTARNNADNHVKYRLAEALQALAEGQIAKGRADFEQLTTVSQQIGLTFDTFFGFSAQDWLAFEDQVKHGQQHTRILRFEL